MARMRFRSAYNFDSANRQLSTNDLDGALNPDTDMGSTMEQVLGQYGALDLQPAYPGLDIMDGSISGPLSILGDDFDLLSTVMARVAGYETYPAALPALGAWSTPGNRLIKWTPTLPGIYQWYCTTGVTLSMAPAAATIIAMSDPFPDVMMQSYGTDNNTVRNLSLLGGTYHRSTQGMLMASAEMLAAGYGGLAIPGPYYNIQGAEQISANFVYFSVLSWSPGGTVPYMSGI